MAATRLDLVGDNSTTVYNVAFQLGYLSADFVYVYLSSNEYTNQLAYTWLNQTQIVLNSPVPAGVEFHIRRVVQRDNLINDYEAGAILRENNLDDSFLQSLMILEEIADGYSSPSGPFLLNSDVDMLLHKITNLGDATSDKDAINLGQVVTLLENHVASGGSIIVETAPLIVINGQRWTRCADMKSFIWYVDDDGGQWVEDNPSYGYTLTAGASGTFTSSDAKTITVVDGLITLIV